jgi:hypothetical protein
VNRGPFPWAILAAYAVLWFAPRINRWLDQQPRPDRPDQPVRGELRRPDPPGREISRELERREW